MFSTAIGAVKHGKEPRIILLGTLVVGAFCVLDAANYVRFFASPPVAAWLPSSQWGLATLFFAQVVILVRRVVQSRKKLADYAAELSEKNKTLERLLQELKRAEVDRAVAQMAQMLAHDVRKPFSILKMGIDRIASVTTELAVRNLAQKTRFHVERTLAQVNGMIADVLEVGRDAKLQREATSVITLIEAGIVQVFRFQERSDIQLEYDFRHRRKLDVDGAKVLRTLVNIIENARQAMGDLGEITFTTEETLLASGALGVTIGVRNSGSFIPPDEIPHLFSTFYSKGKLGGTGLGLAIVQKVIDLHGGEVRCISDENRGTEFRMTLPIAPVDDLLEGAKVLPRSATAIRVAFENMMAIQSLPAETGSKQ